MKKDYDVIVVGAGPAGSMTAKHAAKKGARVLMIEKRQEIGASLRCAEGINKKGLEKAGVPVDHRWVSTDVSGAKLVSPGGHVFRIDERQAGNEVGMVLERHLFDKAMAADAARAGAEIWLKTAAVDVIKEGDKVVGVKAFHEGKPLKLTAGCVVAADGFESQVARWAGIDTSLKAGDITTCYQYRMANLKIEPDYCEFILGSVAPGGYIWVFPKGDDIANVGIGVLASKLKKPGEVKAHLDSWIKKDPRLSCGQPLEALAGGVSVSPPVERSVMDGLILVGDSARIIDPITGGGIANGLLAGMHAGNVLGDCAQVGDYSEKALMPYDKLWRDDMEDRLWRNWMAKEKFLTLSDKTLDGIIDTLSTANVDKMSVHNILIAIKERYPELVNEFEDLI